MPIKSHPTFDAALVEMTFALGMALTQWQLVEHKIYQLFVFLCGKSDERAINVIFHELSLELKMRAIMELVRLRDKGFLSAWDEASKAVYRQKRLRDKLAHWTVVGSEAEGGKFIAYLCPPTTSLQAKKVIANPNGGAIDADTLRNDAITGFLGAAAAIDRFMHSLPEAP
jgi:hypothetical protein